jgi:ribonuclease III
MGYHDHLTRERLEELERSIGYNFRSQRLLVQALTHSSARDREHACNERLEFLGDAVLGLTISEYLFNHFPDFEEGDLSTIKSYVVSAQSLALKAKDIGLEPLIVLGKGLSARRPVPRSILCNIFEALIASIFLDGTLADAKAFILRNLEKTVEQVLKNEHEKNYKSMLQDHAQKQWTVIPVYQVTRELGPDHGKFFQVTAEVNGRVFGPAWGKSKKEAEQRAARAALIALGLLQEQAPGETEG